MPVYHIGPFELGQIKAHMEHGLGCTEISRRVSKGFDAKGKPIFYSEKAISTAMGNIRENPGWKGARAKGSGAPRKTTKKQDRDIVRWLETRRGKEKVTVSRLKKRFPNIRPLSNTLVEERLDEADLAWLRRRNKTKVTAEYLAERVAYCRSVKRKHQATIDKFAYTDGTVFYLSRTADEHENAVCRSLGTHVWRRSDNRDAMIQDCLGPSSYSKAQGKPVRIWGMLACGVLHVHILDEDEIMNTALYVELVEDEFEKWAGNCEHVVCDFEACLRAEETVEALSKISLTLLEGYPRCSQDFNAIENAWFILKTRLDETMPVHLEGRNDFIKRLKAAVIWVNRNRTDQLWYLSRNQKERADECLETKPPGGRVSF